MEHESKYVQLAPLRARKATENESEETIDNDSAIEDAGICDGSLE